MKRDNNYDLLRIISAVAVIMIHVSATWVSSIISNVVEYGTNIEGVYTPFIICVYNSISRFAVPCFIMLSGAFIIDNERNAKYSKFYSKIFSKIGVPTIVFSGLYILYRIPLCFLRDDKWDEMGILLKDILIGSPMYHMWYLYMFIGIYALTPVIIQFKESISEKTFYKVSFCFLILASVSQWTGKVRLNWDIGQSFEYLGYYMAGYSIRKIFAKTNNFKAIILICIGLIVEICVANMEYKKVIYGIADADLKYHIITPYSPLIVIASIFIYVGFTFLGIKKDCTKLSHITFYVYLIHAGIWDFIRKAFYLIFKEKISMELNGVVWIPGFVVIIFVCSCLLSKLYLRIWNKLDKEDQITNVLIKMVRLES